MARRVNTVGDGLQAIRDGDLKLDEESVSKEVRAELTNMARALIKGFTVVVNSEDKDQTSSGAASKDGTRMIVDIELADQELADGLVLLGNWAQKNGLGDRLTYAASVVGLLVTGEKEHIKWAEVLAGATGMKNKVYELLRAGCPASEVKGILGIESKSDDCKYASKVIKAYEQWTNL